MHLTRVILFRFLWARHRPSLFYSEGCGDGQNRLCHTCSPAERLSSNGSNRKRFAGTVVTSIYPWSKVIVSASSAAVALAFDAGGTERQEDIWVADLTEEETKEFLALHGHENKWEDFVDACASAQYNNMLAQRGGGLPRAATSAASFQACIQSKLVKHFFKKLCFTPQNVRCKLRTLENTVKCVFQNEPCETAATPPPPPVDATC